MALPQRAMLRKGFISVAGAMVNTIKSILLYGDSLWFAGLAAYLQAAQGLRVIQSDPRSLAAIARQANLDLVILDRTQEADALPLLRVHPTATVVSVDTNTGILTALSGRSCQVQTMQEIEQVIRELMAARGSSTGPTPTAPATGRRRQLA
jgi:hypothetical protein